MAECGVLSAEAGRGTARDRCWEHQLYLRLRSVI